MIFKSQNLIYLFFICLVGCSQHHDTNIGQVSQFYKGFQKAQYNYILETLADSLTLSEGGYIMHFSKESFHEQFKWDSVFQPKYAIDKLEEKDATVIATISVRSLRFKFLNNNPLTCQHQFYFEKGKIRRIQTLDCPSADWSVWQKERDTLVEWIQQYHPELDGFVHDLSMIGAQNYLKAIEFYRAKTNQH